MVNQLDINELTQQIKELIPALQKLSGTAATSAATTSKDTDRLVRAIAQMSVQMSKRRKDEDKSIDKFVQSVDRAVDAQQKKTAADTEAAKELEKAAQARSEAERRAGMTALQRAQEDAQKARETARKSREDATNHAKLLAEDQMAVSRSTGLFDKNINELAEKQANAGRDLVKTYKVIFGLSEGLKALGGAAVSVGKALYEGKQGASANNEALEGLGKAAESLGSNFGPLGIIIGKLVKWITGYVVEANKLSDRLYKSYQDLSKVGVTAQDGMMGLAESSQRLGLGLDDAGIENFGRLMKSAAVDLALMSGSAVQGRKDFVDFASTVVRGSAGRELMNLGMSVEQLNEGLAAYIGLQSRVGMTQNKTQAELQAGAAAYLREMDALTKLTGLQRQELEEGINKARAVEAFRAKVEDLRAQGREKEAAQMENYYAVLQKQAPKLAQGYAESAAGMIVSPEGRQFFQAIEAGTGVVEGLSSGTMNATQALSATYKQAKLSEEQFRGLAMAMAAGDVVGSYTELADIAKRSSIDTEEAARLIREVQEAQTKGPGGVAAQTDMRRAQMDSRDALQNMVLKGVQPATSAMSGFAQVVGKVTQALGGPAPKMGSAPGTVGVFGGGGAGAGGAATAPSGAGGAGATAPGGGGGVFGAIGRALGIGGGGGLAEVMDADDIANTMIKFGGNTGSRAHFDKLEPGVKSAFLQMARDYNQLSGGQKLQINSAFRSPEEQAAVDPGTNPKAAPGMSLHNVGRAIDIQSDQRQQLEQWGLLGKYGFKTLPNDPPHIFMQTGGIATGPKTGYQAMLHGTEAVIPLPDGKTIPVEMPNLDRSLEQQVTMMGAQLVALEELVRYMRDNNSISTKILQAAHN